MFNFNNFYSILFDVRGEGQVYINRDWNIILYFSLSSGNIINEILFTKLNFKRKINNLNHAKPWILSIKVVLRVSSSDMLLHVDEKQIFHTIYNRPSPHFLIAWRNANGFGSNFNCCHEGQIVMLKKYFGNIGAETFDSFCRKYFTHLTITWECFLENWRSNKNLKLNLQTLRNL